MTQHKIKKRVICPIMSYKGQYERHYCINKCAFYDEEEQQCCIKTLAQIQKRKQRIDNYVGGFSD